MSIRNVIRTLAIKWETLEMLLKDKSVVVTGAAAGIGRGIAERMAEEGARVVITDIDEEHGRAEAESLSKRGAEAWFVPFDASDTNSIEQMVHEAITLTGGVDVLVNNAGVTRRIEILDLQPEDWDWIQSINTRGLFFCLQAFAKHMAARKQGRIINIASISGKGAKGASNASYVASKAAAIGVTRLAAEELGKHGINVNSICPGLTRTPLLERLAEQNATILDSMTEKTALKRIAEPENIGDAVVFLASRLSSNITGQSINVDNGLLWD